MTALLAGKGSIRSTPSTYANSPAQTSSPAPTSRPSTGGRSFPDDHLTDAELAELLAARAVDEARGLRG